MLYISVDIEADGPCPDLWSMTELGAVVIEEGFERTFHTLIHPEGRRSQPMLPPRHDLSEAIANFETWLTSLGDERLLFVSDNAGFDWQFVNHAFHKYLEGNPFGFSPFSLTSFYKGYARNMRQSFKHLRKTKHDHHALNDAMGNAEAMLWLLTEGGVARTSEKKR